MRFQKNLESRTDTNETKNYQVKEIELYLSEVGDGDPDLQFTPEEEFVMHQRCLGRWTAYNEDDLRNRIFDFIGYHAEHLKYEVRP